MTVLKQLPFVKLLFPLLIGIAITLQFPNCGQYSLAILIPSAILFLLFLINRGHKRNYMVTSISVYFLFFGLGSWLTFKTNLTKKAEDFKHLGLRGHYLIEIVEPPQQKTKTLKLIAKIIGRIDKNKTLLKSEEKVLIYLDTKKRVPKIGDLCLTRCVFKPIQEPENPYQFNYKRYLNNQGIGMQAYIDAKSPFILTGTNRAPFLKKMAHNGSLFLQKLYTANLSDSVALGVIEALIFGYKDDLTKDLVDSFAHTGTLHVLAVSGLHVAIVFLMLAQCLWFLDKWRYGIWLKTVIVLVCIGAYCVLTGLSPSIIRAGLMISLVLIGKALNRNAHIFNTIALSAFIILCINPVWILNVGFQLSFAAVMGIVYLQNYLLPLWTPPNWFFRQVWTILVISFCAQIATFPLSLYYFNQFPNYFLISNLLIIPLSTFVIYFGIGMVVVYKIPLLLSLTAWLSQKTILLINYLIVSIEHWPWSYSDGIKINLFQLITLYICISCMALWLIKANKKFFFYSASCLLLFTMLACFDRVKQQRQSHFIIFNIPSQNSFLCSNGKTAVLITDGLDRRKEMYYIRGYLINARLWPITKMYSLNELLSKNTKNNQSGIYCRNSMLLFGGTVLNFNPKKTGNKNYNQNYIIPSSFNLNTVYALNGTDTVHIGQHKSKRLQNNLKKKLSKYHNCVIYASTHRDLLF